jgi:hypothetical protein
LFRRDAGTRHRRQLELADQQGAQQVRLVLAEPALGEVRDEDAAVPIMNGGSIFERTCPSTLRTGGDISSCPTLFWMGATASAASRLS